MLSVIVVVFSSLALLTEFSSIAWDARLFTAKLERFSADGADKFFSSSTLLSGALGPFSVQPDMASAANIRINNSLLIFGILHLAHTN